MDYLYRKPSTANQIVMDIQPATIITQKEEKPVSHITFISQEEYLRDIETMCARDRQFMDTIKRFCNKVVEVDVVEQPLPSDKSTSVNEEGSK
jgi:hypothetical protein